VLGFKEYGGLGITVAEHGGGVVGAVYCTLHPARRAHTCQCRRHVLHCVVLQNLWSSGLTIERLNFGVWGLGCRVSGVGCGVWDLRCGVWGVGFGVWGMGCRVLEVNSARAWVQIPQEKVQSVRTWVQIPQEEFGVYNLRSGV
jgi:hypothetical protein